MPGHSLRVTIRNKKGLHARAAARFVGVAGQFEAMVTVRRECPTDAAGNSHEQLEVHGGSILGLMMLAAEPGTTLRLTATGDDAEAALAALQALIDDKFGEGE